MATIKSYTDISQSKKLAKFLPPESADTIWDLTNPDLPTIRAIPYEDSDYNNKYLNIIAAWSLAALLNILAKIASKIDDDGSANLSSFMGQWSVNMFDCPVEVTGNYDNPIDACVEMIIKLKERNLL